MVWSVFVFYFIFTWLGYDGKGRVGDVECRGSLYILCFSLTTYWGGEGGKIECICEG